MRYTHQCPKCSSHNVVEVKGSNMNQYQKIPLNKWSLKNAILDRYICTDCGYTEEFVQLTDNFKKWARKALRDQNYKYDDYV